MVYFFIAMVLVAVDQLVKYLVMTNIAFGDHVPFIPYILELTYVENTGAAFSIFSSSLPLISSSFLSLCFISLSRSLYSFSISRF